MTFPSDVVFDVVKQVCQTMLFAECELLDGGLATLPSGGGYRTRIEYAGELDGIISMVASREICSEWAALMAGESSEELSMDALKEITNIIGGNLLNRCASGNGKVKLHPPSVEISDSFDIENPASHAKRTYLTIDDHPILLAVLPRT